MPNPGGTNQFQGFAAEPPYGDVARQQQLTQEAPMSATPALDAPRRAKRQATKQQPAPLPQAPVAAPPHISPQAAAANAWQQIASDPGASDLVREYAMRAQSG